MARGKESQQSSEVKPKRKYHRREKVVFPYTLIVEMAGKKPQTINAHSIRLDGGFLKCVVGPNHEQWFDEHSIVTLDLQTTVVQLVQPIKLTGTGIGTPIWLPNTTFPAQGIGGVTTGSPMPVLPTITCSSSEETPDVFVNPHLAAARSSASEVSKARKPVSSKVPNKDQLPTAQIVSADGQVETVGASIV